LAERGLAGHLGRAGAAILGLLLLAGCAGAIASTPTSSVTSDAGASEAAASPEPVAAAAALLLQRYELVRDGDYAGACALYSEGYAVLFAELAETVGQPCIAAHEAAAANVAHYLDTTAQQNRLGLTPFFYVPTGIEVDATAITADGDDIAIVGPGAVVSTDPREFEDGIGKTPGWLAGSSYVQRTDDGRWLFIAPGEK
jgi:hypothetical protein